MTNELIFYIVGLIIGAIGGYCARWAWSKPSNHIEVDMTIDLYCPNCGAKLAGERKRTK